jgi:hypothetical protein
MHLRQNPRTDRAVVVRNQRASAGLKEPRTDALDHEAGIGLKKLPIALSCIESKEPGFQLRQVRDHRDVYPEIRRYVGWCEKLVERMDGPCQKGIVPRLTEMKDGAAKLEGNEHTAT